jgi:hypothetical protein
MNHQAMILQTSLFHSLVMMPSFLAKFNQMAQHIERNKEL